MPAANAILHCLRSLAALAQHNGLKSSTEISAKYTALERQDFERQKKAALWKEFGGKLVDDLHAEGQEAERELAATADDYALRKAAVLAIHCRCANPSCTNMAGGCEARMRIKVCGGCKVARYCSGECQKVDWGAGHKGACRRMKELLLVRQSSGSA